MTKQYTIIIAFLFLTTAHSASAMSRPKTTNDLPIATLIEKFNNYTPSHKQLHHTNRDAKHCYLYEFPKKTVTFKPNKPKSVPIKRWVAITFHQHEKSGQLMPKYKEHSTTIQFRFQ